LRYATTISWDMPRQILAHPFQFIIHHHLNFRRTKSELLTAVQAK
jgi:hypothetical protein